MALDALQRLTYNRELEMAIDKAINDFNVYKARLQAVFDLVQGYIDNPDTDSNHVTVLTTRKAQGKTLIQAMLDGIT